MKNMLFALLLLAPCAFLSAQYDRHQAPEQVQQSFHRDYPQADNAHWQQSNGRWHAQFNDRGPQDNGEMVAHYDRHGHHLESHIPYAQDDVPAEVTRRAQRTYHGARSYRYTRIERSMGPDLFQLQVDLGGRKKTAYFDENGRTRNYEGRY